VSAKRQLRNGLHDLVLVFQLPTLLPIRSRSLRFQRMRSFTASRSSTRLPLPGRRSVLIPSQSGIPARPQSTRARSTCIRPYLRPPINYRTTLPARTLWHLHKSMPPRRVHGRT
jgi:hypothetical protein